MENSLPDHAERKAALDPARSFIVQAPAGSGKTELLIGRFLRLLASVETPEQVLAITFTRKAAGEMHGRIMAALERAKTGIAPDTPHEGHTFDLAVAALERDRQFDWNILDAPARLKVQTMDALSASITRQMPILSGLGRQPMISEAPEELYRKAARRTIDRIGEEGRNGEAVAEALRHLDNAYGSLEKRLIAMLATRDQWKRHITLKQAVSDEALSGYLEASLQRLIAHSLAHLHALFPPNLLSETLHYGKYAAANLSEDGNSKSAVIPLAGLKELPQGRFEDFEAWRGIRELLMTGKGDWRKPGGVSKRQGFPADKTDEALAMKKGLQTLLETFATSNDQGRLKKALASIDHLPNGRYDDREWTILIDLLHLLPLAEEELLNVFREEGTTDFQALSRAALDALGPDENPTDLMLALDLKLKHLLIDEYQDTSRTQLALVEALTRGWEEGDGRTLFIVGDPMQSIYLFREAEVGLFLKAGKEGVGPIKLEYLTLKSNFRSQPELIDWVNETLHNAFPADEDPFLGAVPYTPFEAVHPRREEDAVQVTLFDGRSDLKEAEEIVSTIETIRTKEKDATVAILARSRSHLTEIVGLLKEKGIDFRTTGLDPLAERPVVQDLLALLRALMHPMDRTAWLALLRAPWCGLSLADLHALCVGDSVSALLELMRNEGRLKTLSEDGRRRLDKVKSVLAKTVPLWGRTRPRPLLEGFWTALGGPACTEGDGMTDAGLFLDMVEEVTEGGMISSLDALEKRMTGLYADQSGRSSSPVELLTIHKAKGLEFDYVILPGIGKPPRRQEKKLIRAMERGEDLLIAPIEGMGQEGESGTYRCIGRLEERKAVFEQVRLFYVAVTRAKKGLHLFGHVKTKEGGEPGVEANSFLASALQIIEPENLIPRTEEEEGTNKPLLKLKRLPTGWQMPPPAPALQVEMEERKLPDFSKLPEFLWAGEAIKHLGTAVHRCLSRIAGNDPAEWDARRLKEEEGVMTAHLRQLGINGEEAARLAAEGADILSKTLEDDRGRWILEKHTGGEAEHPLSALIGGKVIHRVIDRTFVDGNTRWIIDYKISRHKGSDLDSFLKNELERYRAQLDEYEAILKAGGESLPIKKGLYYPAQSGWIEW